MIESSHSTKILGIKYLAEITHVYSFSSFSAHILTVCCVPGIPPGAGRCSYVPGLKPNFNISHSQEVLSMYMCEALYKSMSQHTLIKSVYMLSHITVEEPGHHHPAQACALGCHDSPTTVPSAEGSTSTHTCHMCLRKHRCQLMSCCLSYEVHIKLA